MSVRKPKTPETHSLLAYIPERVPRHRLEETARLPSWCCCRRTSQPTLASLRRFLVDSVFDVSLSEALIDGEEG